MNAESQKVLVRGLEWLSERVPYPESAVTGDTYPMTWADDDQIYASSGDPMWGWCLQDTGMDVERFCGSAPGYRITRPNLLPDFLGYGGFGPKPSGMICVDGKLYLAAQNLCGGKPPRHGVQSQHGNDAHILVSTDHGVTWTPSFKDIAAPMFSGNLFGGPAFINFGRNNDHARDGYVYAVSGDQWDNGSELRLGRVPNEQILNRKAWEWVAEIVEGHEPRWTQEVSQSRPVLVKNRAISLPEMVYLQSLRRYLLLTWRLHEDFSPRAGTDLFIYESPEPWGPFSLVYSEEMWEGQAVNPYCPRLPLKWLEADGITGWLQFSGSWMSAHDRDGFRPYYRSNIRKFRLIVE